ncbi:MAG: anaerobic ribonucleoside-triphosphate reductase activating protein [Anaerolineae bacterium]|nr:anaerobic ribonucleoside-triphosphate reductase activating protein [Anaerolineae bacterium]
MRINGWARTSLIDFPQHIAAMLFAGGCNFRCPMCHNTDLVLHPADLPVVATGEILAFLSARIGKLTGVVLSGGEPTLQPDLADFARAVRALGYAVKLDTNGYLPDALAALLDAGLLDYVAMDLKAPPEKYALLSGLPSIDMARVAQSVALLAASDIPHEFRTTIVPGLLAAGDIVDLSRWLAGVTGDALTCSWYLQSFRGLNTLDPALEGIAPYSPADMQTMADQARQWVPHVAVRGF